MTLQVEVTANVANSEASIASSSSGSPISAPSKSAMDREEVPTSTAEVASDASKGNFLRSSRIGLSIILEICLLAIPFMTLTISYMCQQLYLGPFVKYMDSFRIMDQGSDERGYYYSLDQDVTYYHRHCTKQDITTYGHNKTHRSNLVMLPAEQTTPEYAQDIMMKHGAVILPNVLSDKTATKLRSYLESRHEIQDSLSWQEKFWTGINRLSLGLGFDDDESIQEALQEIGDNPMIASTLEGLFGEPDAAIVEISTLTSLHGAENQGLHSDSDYFGSSLLYGRTFLHSYTMFVALQDTTSRMGATTVCPGTHWCANPDMEEICLPFEYEYQEEDVQEAFDAYNDNEAFDVSSNGITKKEAGVLLKGDAMMFNQNVFHRGPQNDDPTFKDTNRVMFIVTFVNKRDFEKHGDVRQQGMGTYYYQRWTMWGHSFSDFKHALKRNSYWQQPWATLKTLGLTASKAVPWPEHVARQLANEMDFFLESELPDFKEYMELTNGDLAKHVQQGTSFDDWHEYLPAVLQNFVTAGIYVYQRGLLAVLVLGLVLSPGGTRLNFCKRLLGWHLVIAGMGYVIYHGIEQHSFLGQKILSEKIQVTPFDTSEPPIPPKATTLPDRVDYLVGSRYDADFLGSFNRVLDYHPGNVQLDTLVDEFATSELPCDCLAQLIQDQWDRPKSASPPRMLQQDAATGYWSVMTSQSTMEYMERLILRRQQPLLGYVDKYVLQALANARFGRLRETSMAKFHTIPLLKDLEQKLVLSYISSASKIEAKSGSILSLRPSLLLDPTTLAATLLRSPTKLLRSTETPDYLTPGSRVWAASRTDPGFPGQWEAARVIETLDNGLVKVVYDVDGIKERTLTNMLVQPYRHFVQGDKVEIMSATGPTWTWRTGVIESVAPLGWYNVVTEDGQLVSRITAEYVRIPPLREKLQSGDVVWAAVNGNEEPTKVEGGWAKAIVVETSNDDKLLVKYDGYDLWEEKKLYDVQPYYTIEDGDFVEMRLDDGYWWVGNIEGVFDSSSKQNDSEDSEDDSGDHGSKTDYDIYVEELDQFFEAVEERHIRPLLPLLEKGTRVLARYGGEEHWFPGRIDRVNTYRRTYRIKYDDGDLENNVSRDFLQLEF